MKKSTKAVSLALVMLMLLSSCAGGNENNVETLPSTDTTKPVVTEDTTAASESESETEEEKILPDIPASADYGDDQVLFLVWDRAGWAETVRRFRDITADEITGEAINDTVFNRNLKIEDAYKVKIGIERVPDNTIVKTINTEITAGETNYDVVYPRLNEASSLFTGAQLHNLHKVNYIDLTKPWWDQNCVESLTTKGYLPCAASALNVNDKDATAAIAFNKTIASNNQIEDLYTVVREGKWTYDKLSSIAETVMQDANGDGVMTPEEDIYGFLGARDVTESFYYGSGGQMVSKNSDGVFELTFGSERDLNVTEKIIDLMNQPWFMNHHLIANQDDNYYRQLFEQGYGLFFWMRLDEVTNMRASDADFGILPIPKYEEAQDKYYSMVSRYITGLPSIPITLTGEKLDEVGLVLEALSAESYYTLIPEYIETSLKTKNSRDAESADMLDIIINNRVFDPMHIYNFGSFSSDYLSLGDTADKNIASWLKSKQKLVQKTIDRTVQNIEDAE